MKRTIIDIVKIVVACIVAILATMGVDALGIGYQYGHVAVFFCVAIGMLAILGVFSERKGAKHDSIRHYNGRRHYGQAAIFIGTACIFMGSPQECEDVCDDLWHYGQQAHVEMLSGEETLEVL